MERKDVPRIKIFTIYHRPAEIYGSSVYTPILSGAAANTFPELRKTMCCDDTGDNISSKNANYGELCCWYWVWKNYLPRHPEMNYIGFGHYRRLLVLFDDADYLETAIKSRIIRHRLSLPTLDRLDYRELFERNNADDVVPGIVNQDIIVGQSVLLPPSLKAQYLSSHPKRDWMILEDIINRRHPEKVELFNRVVNQPKVCYGMQFVMKTALFLSFMEWVFPILEEIESKSDWAQYDDYYSARVPAYLAERMFMVWLEAQKENNAKILENPVFLREPRSDYSKSQLFIGDALYVFFKALAKIIPHEPSRRRVQNWYRVKRFKK